MASLNCVCYTKAGIPTSKRVMLCYVARLCDDVTSCFKGFTITYKLYTLIDSGIYGTYMQVPVHLVTVVSSKVGVRGQKVIYIRC